MSDSEETAKLKIKMFDEPVYLFTYGSYDELFAS